jgi:hypothetical protein
LAFSLLVVDFGLGGGDWGVEVMGVSWFCGVFVVLEGRGVSPTISDTDFNLIAPDDTLVTGLSEAGSLGIDALATPGDLFVGAGGPGRG